MRKLFRWLIRWVLLFAVFILCLLLLKWRADSRFYDAYKAGAALNSETLSQKKWGSGLVRLSRIDGVAGSSIPLLSYYPAVIKESPVPCVIFLHGIGQQKSFLETIAPFFTDHGYAVISFDQYMCGERKLPDGATLLEKAFAVRRRAALTVMETRRVVDYLQNDAKIAPDRIYLAGASFGAMMGSIATAQEPRIAGAALIYGGGDWKQFRDSEYVRAKFGSWTPLIATFTAYLMAPADPVLYAGSITSTRPLLIQNGSRDSYIPRAATDALIEAAGGRAEVIWYDSDHIGIEKEKTKTVLIDALLWLDQVDK